MTIIPIPNRGFKCVYDFCGLEAEINYDSNSIIKAHHWADVPILIGLGVWLSDGWSEW